MAELPERDAGLLLDMLLAARDALSFVADIDEAAGKVSAATREAHPEIAWRFEGATAPTSTKSDLVYLEARLQAGAALPIGTEHEERCVFVVSGAISIAGTRFMPGQMAVLKPGRPVTVHAEDPSRVMLAGGAPLDGPRHIWWNFVSSDPARIEQAKADWAARRFPSVLGDDAEFIPLPDME